MNLVNANTTFRDLKADKTFSFVTNKIKEIVHRYDANADIILFGSRARGDWNEESDGDFLILTSKNVTPDLKKRIIYEMHDVELEENIVLQFLIKNKKDWEIRYLNSPLYLNIKDEGLKA
jgi:predicted nucleotidyltransferase